MDGIENKGALTEVEERLRSTKDCRMFERLQAVRLRIMEMTVKEIADILCHFEKTIRSYIHICETEGSPLNLIGRCSLLPTISNVPMDIHTFYSGCRRLWSV